MIFEETDQIVHVLRWVLLEREIYEKYGIQSEPVKCSKRCQRLATAVNFYCVSWCKTWRTTPLTRDTLKRV